ncbi:alpha-1,4-glucan--maltose-1-phosphate maltosyltransferase [Sphingomonas sp. S1-29]|uniref:alpha-1,4-glucan--maltose-1-phosphate maltosyltransferase n=1 Tax=Sphingomonas sp. S1-29 TaxID=2991074 RepID=UPI0022408BD0|nr:alpha-1,4-glucan--maltose-1-phosphate maltosyltransferase [Sphingomonas sp. S1-29]UZK69924.1 alpha-1,4-glucan--maltose-1-phosphate maltosyltransferase [Sphingomonas sp. S1-29]
MAQGAFGAERGLPVGLQRRCDDAGLALLLDIDLARFPIEHPLVTKQPALFALRRSTEREGPVDPRVSMPASGEARARLRAEGAIEALLPAIADRLIALLDAGAQGFRFFDADRIAPQFLTALVAQLRAHKPDVMTIARAAAGPQALANTGLDGVVSSFGVCDLRSPRLVEERQGSAAALIAEPSPGQLADAHIERSLTAAAALSDGLIVPLDVLVRYPDLANRAVGVIRQAAGFAGEMRRLNGAGSAVAAFLRADTGDVRNCGAAMLVLVNTTAKAQPAPAPADLLSAAGAAFEPLGDDAFVELQPGEVRMMTTDRAKPILLNPAANGAVAAAQTARLVIEDVSPIVEGGFPVKRVVGEAITVGATVFADGHEQLAVELLWRAADASEWTTVPMAELPNLRWQASFATTRMGRHEFVIEAWLDRFGGFTRDFRKKLDAGVATSVDHAEGRLLVEQARDRSKGSAKKELGKFATSLKRDDNPALLLSDELAAVMARADDRPHRLRSAVQPVDAERLTARFSSWYELFPRSQSTVPGQHGSFDDVIPRLPAIRDMGFDTLYFPPIHPIGTANRKGPNNTLTPAPGDPGSPYAIGAPEGGHDAIHPELGSLEDFLRLVDAARDHGMEIALDFAIQCSPDHPWLKEHPGWFAWRPDGSMKYAENPPKKYQDIVNVEFYAKDAVPGLWAALRDVVLLWIERGVKTFRVDNPHTKTLPFWEWMIGDVRARHPEAIFLAEAFTKPAMMYRLAKVGFSQSYTYFTWRDEKAELTDYITELTTTPPKEFYRPHFFVNTPDINPLFLQTSGRPGFRIRAVLAATLSGLFGVYSGFELCEAAPVPGKEEYLDSEKYEIRQRDWTAPGNIIADITMLNRLRRAYPALQTHLNTRFYAAHNDRIIYFAKPAPDGADMILVMVSLDPHNPQEADFEVPLWEFGLSDTASIAVEDLAEGHRFDWHGKTQHIRLDPDQPYRIWRIAPGETA